MVDLCNSGMSRPRTYTSRQIERARKKARKGGWTLKKQSGTAYRAVRAKKSTSTRRRTARRTTRSATRRPRMSNPSSVERSGRMNSRAMGAFYDAPPSLRLGGEAFMIHSASSTMAEARTEAGRFRSETGRKARVVKRKVGSRNFYFVYKGNSRRR